MQARGGKPFYCTALTVGGGGDGGGGDGSGGAGDGGGGGSGSGDGGGGSWPTVIRASSAMSSQVLAPGGRRPSPTMLLVWMSLRYLRPHKSFRFHSVMEKCNESRRQLQSFS